MTDAKKIWEAWGQANALYTGWAAENGLNSYRLFVLYAIDGHDEITQKRIAELTGFSRQTVNTVIRTLKAEGLIVLSPGTGDRREKTIRLTPAGLEYSKAALSGLYKLENEVSEIIGTDRINEMMNSIKLFTTVFEKEFRKEKDFKKDEPNKN